METDVSLQVDACQHVLATSSDRAFRTLALLALARLEAAQMPEDVGPSWLNALENQLELIQDRVDAVRFATGAAR